MIRETASGARADAARLYRAIAQLEKGDVLMVTRLDRLARPTPDLLNTLARSADKGATLAEIGCGYNVSGPTIARLASVSVCAPAVGCPRELVKARPNCYCRQVVRTRILGCKMQSSWAAGFPNHSEITNRI